jgi:hypothetical protein
LRGSIKVGVIRSDAALVEAQVLSVLLSESIVAAALLMNKTNDM